MKYLHEKEEQWSLSSSGRGRISLYAIVLDYRLWIGILMLGLEGVLLMHAAHAVLLQISIVTISFGMI
jgi:hypothetical protein